MGKLITIKNFTIEIHDEDACNCSMQRCHEMCGFRSLKPDEFINNFVEINQGHGFFVGFDKYKIEEMD